MNNKVILLVEDNPEDEALTLHAFKKNKIMKEVVVVRDGAEALDYLFGTGAYAGRDFSVTPTLILLDLDLPKLSGLEVLRRLRQDERTKLLPVVMMTSSREEQDMINAYKLGINSYVCKPVNFAEFIASVQTLGIYWLAINEPLPIRR